MNAASSEQKLKDEIDRLERQLAAARSKLQQLSQPTSVPPALPTINHAPSPSSTPHALLLLSDSALPLGSFAFSSGLESYLAHHKPLPPGTTPLQSFHRFLHLSLASAAGISIPYIRAAYESPEELEGLDNDLDASTACTVARRASVAQGRALLGVWERALRSASPATAAATPGDATHALSTFSAALKSPSPSNDPLGPNGHFPLLWSLVCRSLSVPLPQTAYVFLLNHAKAVISAAVRAGVMGPYQAHAVLASAWLQHEITVGVSGNWDVGREEAGQTVPLLELWGGRHELLYSRIFNS